MRTLATLVMGITIALPGVAVPATQTPSIPSVNGKPMTADRNGQVHVGDCRRLAKQIIHFENVKAMAEERNDALWARGTQAHINHLEGQWNNLCYDGIDEWQVAFNKLVKTAAEAAIRYFTWSGF
jgi:hypothetical protein